MLIYNIEIMISLLDMKTPVIKIVANEHLLMVRGDFEDCKCNSGFALSYT